MVKKMEKKRMSTSSKGSSDPKLLKQEIKGQVFGEVMGEWGGF
jgi:hypothetical protein